MISQIFSKEGRKSGTIAIGSEGGNSIRAKNLRQEMVKVKVLLTLKIVVKKEEDGSDLTQYLSWTSLYCMTNIFIFCLIFLCFLWWADFWRREFSFFWNVFPVSSVILRFFWAYYLSRIVLFCKRPHMRRFLLHQLFTETLLRFQNLCERS